MKIAQVKRAHAPCILTHGAVDAFENVFVWLGADQDVFSVAETVRVQGRNVSPKGAKSLIDEDFASIRVGQDPFDVDRIHEAMNSRISESWTVKAIFTCTH